MMNRDTMLENVEVVRAVLDDLGAVAREQELDAPERDLCGHAFLIRLVDGEKRADISIFLDEQEALCSMAVIYPFSVAPEMAYPLCEALSKDNHEKKFGAFRYDAAAGDVSFVYNFLVRHGMYEDDFRDVLMAMIDTVGESYDMVRRNAVGALRSNDRAAHIYKAQRLIIELCS